MVHVLVREHDQLEVLDPDAEFGQSALQVVERGAGVQAGVDQRQRLAGQQVAVDPPDGKRRGYGDPVDARLRLRR